MINLHNIMPACILMCIILRVFLTTRIGPFRTQTYRYPEAQPEHSIFLESIALLWQLNTTQIKRQSFRLPAYQQKPNASKCFVFQFF